MKQLKESEVKTSSNNDILLLELPIFKKEIQCIPKTNLEFQSKSYPITLVFNKTKSGDISGLIVQGIGEDSKYLRLE